ncbi:MAG: hypothetical protein OEM91_08030 [Hyphomicrobiales bacterium]|nr:hypothetical protein [Hyphomicrobiales bacterium]
MIKDAFIILIAALVLVCGSPGSSRGSGEHRPPGAAGTQAVPVHFFWSETCPHCTKAKAFLDALAKRDAGIGLQARKLPGDEATQRAFIAVSRHFNISPPAVPLITVGERVFAGYDDDATSGAGIRSEIEACRASSCEDVAGTIIGRALLARSGSPSERPSAVVRPSLPETLSFPILGSIRLQTLSLPVLTVVLGAIDGFNPCAMWVLIFLIGLLLGMQDSFRMWSYGAVFLLTSAAVYFVFLAAWLNVFLLLGSLAWIRVAVGLFALGAGSYYLWQFASIRDAVCPVTSPAERQTIMTRLKQAVGERSYLLAISGIVVLAVAVNLIELLCSAGIPAVYTQVLALNELQPAVYYGYLTLYIAVFLLDDAIVFVTAMVTLRAAGLAATYVRYSHLIGGVVLGGIGILLLLRPDLLAFA